MHYHSPDKGPAQSCAPETFEGERSNKGMEEHTENKRLNWGSLRKEGLERRAPEGIEWWGGEYVKGGKVTDCDDTGEESIECDLGYTFHGLGFKDLLR